MEIEPEFIPTVSGALRLAAANVLETDLRHLRVTAHHLGNSPVVVPGETVSGGAGHSNRLTRCPDFRMRNLFLEAGDLPASRGSTRAGSCDRCQDDRASRKHWGNVHHRSVSSRLHGTLVRGGDHHATPNFVEADR